MRGVRPWMVLLTACGAGEELGPEPVQPYAVPKVLVVGWDGARGDATEAAFTPNLDRVGAWGGLSFDATTQLTGPTVSAPGWMSIATGVGPDVHGVVSNGEYDGRDWSWSTFVHRAREAELRTAAAVVWGEVAYSVIGEDVLDHAAWSGEDEVADWMVERIAAGDTDVHFVHQDAPDHAGHDSGYDVANPDYIEAIEASDRRLGRLLDAVQLRGGERWMVAVTTDHGGSGTGHGPMDADNQTIFFGVAEVGGPGGVEMSGASHLDVHPTVVGYLGLEPDERGLPGVARL